MYNDANPFTFGALALDEAFTDREDELKELAVDIRNGQDVLVFAPRRYGKSSLVLRAAQEALAKGVLVAYCDLMKTPTKERFAGALAKTIYEDLVSPVGQALEKRPRCGIEAVPRDLHGSPPGLMSPSSSRAGSALLRLRARLDGVGEHRQAGVGHELHRVYVDSLAAPSNGSRLFAGVRSLGREREVTSVGDRIVDEIGECGVRTLHARRPHRLAHAPERPDDLGHRRRRPLPA